MKPALIAVTVTVLLANMCNAKEGTMKKKPNMVFILSDDVNRDTWGTYGSKDCKTPNIDRLAEDGVRFEKAYCAVAMCAPFRQELYSGRTPWRTKTWANHSKSVPGTKSIAHYLKPLGYRVALIGKSHIGPKECYPFEYFLDKGKGNDQNPFYMKTAKTVMDDCAKKDQPFCMFIASHDGHGPYTTGDPSAYDADKLTIPPYWIDTPELRRNLVKWYAEITNFDKLVGDMRAELERRGQWENTIFMVCSEQGTAFPFAKWTCYDNGLHTGLVAHWGNVTKPGQRVNELVSIADVTPTLVEAAGGKLKPKDCDGKSFLPLLKGNDKKLHNYVYGAFTNCNIIGNRDRIYPIRVIRTDSHTLLYNPNHTKQTSNTTLDDALEMLNDPAKDASGIAPSWVKRSRKEPNLKPVVHKLHHRPEYELYDLAKDPYELKNVIDDPAYSTVAETLKKQLLTQLKEWGDADPIKTETSLVKPGKGKNNRKKK